LRCDLLIVFANSSAPEMTIGDRFRVILCAKNSCVLSGIETSGSQAIDEQAA